MTQTPFHSLLKPFERPAPTQTSRNSVDQQRKQAAVALAMRDATSIISDARAEAAQLIEDATIQAEAIREAAWQEGHCLGQKQGLAQGEAESRQESAANIELLRSEVQGLVDQIGCAWATLWLEQEPAMLALVMKVARQVIKTEIAQNKDVIVELVKNCLRRVTDKENVRIRLSIADSEQVKSMRDDLMLTIDGLRGLEIVDDRRINEGGCIIETNAGSIDARIPTQLGEIEKALNLAELE